MTQKLALKKLTKSDLTLFKWHFDQQKSNQKAINLNRNVLVDQLYPSLPIIIEEKQGTIPLDLYIYGPGLATEYNLQRKIQKTDSYKNYRLNGEFIADPQDDSDRFHTLKPDDFVIFDFCGDLEPYSARAVFIAQSLTEDAKFHQLLENLINSRSMITLQTQELKSLIEQANLLNQHPAKLLTTESNLEDAALGGIEGITALRSGPYHGKVSRKDLENAKKDAHKTGRLGEEWVLNYLEMKKQKNLILDFNWIANDNAISPYDFSIVALDESIILIDVKSTK